MSKDHLECSIYIIYPAEKGAIGILPNIDLANAYIIIAEWEEFFKFTWSKRKRNPRQSVKPGRGDCVYQRLILLSKYFLVWTRSLAFSQEIPRTKSLESYGFHEERRRGFARLRILLHRQ